MSSFDTTETFPLDRQLLEAMVAPAVCACLSYELANNLEITGDQELISVINQRYIRDACGSSS